MTKRQAINYVKSSLNRNDYKAIMEAIKTDRQSVLNYLRKMGINEEVLALI